MGKLSLEELKFWLSEVESSEERQKRELIERNNYPFLIQYYEGKLQIDPMHPHVATHALASVINDYFPSINSLISEIMYQNPDIIVDPAKPTAEVTDPTTGQIRQIDVVANTPTMKGAIVYAMDKTEMLIENRVGLFDMITAGYCAVETNHIISKEDVLNLPTEEQMKQRSTSLVQKAVNALKKSKTMEDADKKLEKEKADKEAFATNEKTYVKRWNPIDILFDWKAERFKDSRYLIKRIHMSKAEFDVKYPDFKNQVNAGDNIPFARHEHDKHNKRITVYEIQIKKKNHEYWTLVLTKSLKNSELDFFKRPFTTNTFDVKIGTLHKYGKIYPIALAQINKKMSDELNEYVMHKKDVAERNVPKYLITDRVKQHAKEALRSPNTNDLVEVEGNLATGAVEPLRPTKVAPDNDELILLFREQSEKGWGVSALKQQGLSGAKFATEIQIQEAGFQGKTIDLQEGLRLLIKTELDALKDIIVTFWDDAVFFKITGGAKPEWYQTQVINGQVINPLADILTGDYFIKVDISSALRPNLEKKKNDDVLLLREMISPAMQSLLLQKRKTIDLNFINRIVRNFGHDPETVFQDITPEELATLQQAAQAEAT